MNVNCVESSLNVDLIFVAKGGDFVHTCVPIMCTTVEKSTQKVQLVPGHNA